MVHPQGPDRKKWRLCVIVGGEENPLESARAALTGGARFLQYRGKQKTGERQLREARALRAATRRFGACFVVNDRADIACLAEADGLHLGRGDLPVAAARRLLRPGSLIGATAHTLEEAEAAVAAGADYLGCGAVFPSRSKRDVAVMGTRMLAAIVRRVSVPVIGIGGITASNAADVFRTGVTGVAVLSALSDPSKTSATTGELLAQIPEGT